MTKKDTIFNQKVHGEEGLDILNSRGENRTKIDGKEALKYQNQYLGIYQELFEKTTDASLILKDGRFINCNFATVELLKYKEKEDILEKHPYELSPPQQSDGRFSDEKAEEMIRIALKNGSHRFEWEHLTATGEILPVEVLLTPIKSDDGLQLIHTTWRDISERKKSEKIQKALFDISEEASKSKSVKEFYGALHQIIKKLMPAKNFYIAIHNAETNLISFPYHVDEYDPVPEPEPFGNGLTEYVLNTKKSHIITAEQDLELQKKGLVALSGELAKVWVGIYLNFEGNYKGVLVLQNYEDENAYNEESLKVLQFVSEHIVKVLDKEFADARLRKSFKELSEAKEKAERADRLKTTFLAQMSHEIRTPINAMLSLSSLLKDDLEDKVDEESKVSFQLINKAGLRIIRTIDLLLNLSEIQTGTYEIIKKEFNLYSDILGKIILEYKKQALDKGIEIKMKLLTDDTNIVADFYTVEQIFMHLIDNAVKYTNDGNIIIKLFRDKENKLNVEVSDTGIGITGEYLPKLFEPFTQEDEGYTRKYDGNGIGLSLVKNYCEMNNAEIEVESKKGVGTTFRVLFK